MILDRTNPRLRLLAGFCLLLLAIVFVAESAHAHNVGVRSAAHDCTVCAAHQAAVPGVSVQAAPALTRPTAVVVAAAHPAPLSRPTETHFVRPPPAQR